MIPLLRSQLNIPPSVNSRAIISARGGTLHPAVRKYQADAHLILLSDETTRYTQSIVNARESRDFLHVALWFYLPEARQSGKCGEYFLSRDLDNMAQVIVNVLKVHLGIDDVRILDLELHKRVLPPGVKHAYVQVCVSALEAEEYSQEAA